jgi:hypothetical protein
MQFMMLMIPNVYNGKKKVETPVFCPTQRKLKRWPALMRSWARPSQSSR